MVQLSATQLKSAQLCHRQRFFRWGPLHLPTPHRGYQAFGTVLHGVVERYLKGDILGYDNRGNPVNFYPEGWATAKNKEGELEGELGNHEQTLIKTLVAQAIEEGVIERKPGGRVEESFDMDLRAGVKITGTPDYTATARIEDHKTSKNRRYLMSSDALTNDVQMMLYAIVRLQQARARGERDPETIELAHNQFIKGDNPGVRKTEARVTPRQVEEFWGATILPLIDACVEYEETVKDPLTDIPDPGAGACAAYGGCSFIGICTRQESIAHYRKRVDTINKKPQDEEVPDLPPEKGQKMSLADLLKDREANRVSGIPPAAKNAPIQTAPTATPTPTPSSTVKMSQDFPPWADPACGACSSGATPGFNSKGSPCRICDAKAVRENRPNSSQFVIEAMPDGSMIWEPKAPVVGQSGKTLVTVAAVVTEAPPPVAPTPAPAPSPVTQAKVVAPPAIVVSSDEEVRVGPKRGRPLKGITLVIGNVQCLKMPGDMTPTLAEQVLQELVCDGKLYFQINDVWSRRGWVQANAATIAGALKGNIVQVIANPDVDNLMSSLAPHAEGIWRGQV